MTSCENQQLALQSFASHHLCETLDSLFPKLQTACLKAYQPPSNKLPTSATLMMWCLMVGALQYYWIKLIKQLDNINWFKSLTHSVLHWAWNIFCFCKKTLKGVALEKKKKSIQRAKQRKYTSYAYFNSKPLESTFQPKYFPHVYLQHLKLQLSCGSLFS